MSCLDSGILFVLLHLILITSGEVYFIEKDNYTSPEFKYPTTKPVLEKKYNDSKCYNFSEEFPMKKVIEIGSWFIVGIIPTDLYPKDRQQTCKRVDFNECDVSALRWLVKTSKAGSISADVLERISGSMIIRQRYQTIPPADVWSKNVEGFQGCFEQVASMDTYKTEETNHDEMFHEGALMQLRLVKGSNEEEYLVQMLWGDLISAVVYRNESVETNVTSLKPVMDMLTKLRGKQKSPLLCKNPSREPKKQDI